MASLSCTHTAATILSNERVTLQGRHREGGFKHKRAVRFIQLYEHVPVLHLNSRQKGFRENYFLKYYSVS